MTWGVFLGPASVVAIYTGVNLWGRNAWEDEVDELNARGYRATAKEALFGKAGDSGIDYLDSGALEEEVRRIELDDEPLGDISSMGLAGVNGNVHMGDAGGQAAPDPALLFSERIGSEKAARRLLDLLDPYEARRKALVEVRPSRIHIFRGLETGASNIPVALQLKGFLSDHAVVSLVAQRPDLFMEDLRTVIAWTAAMQRTRQTMMGGVISIGVQLTACDLILEGLNSGILTADDLQLITQDLSLLDPEGVVLKAMEVEVSMIIESFPLLMEDPPKLDRDAWMDDWEWSGEKLNRKLMSVVYAYGPSGLHHKGYANYLIGWVAELESSDGKLRGPLTLDDLKRFKSHADAKPSGFDLDYNFFAPPYDQEYWAFLEVCAFQSLKGRTGLMLIRHAVELEHFHRNHGCYPERIDGLGLETLDPFSEANLNYRIESDGGYTVWSVGKDGLDEGGTGDDQVFRRWIR